MVNIQSYTTIVPLDMIGYEAGICWNAPVDDPAKNEKRAMNCISSNHGRTLEFPQIYLEIDGYSAKVMREFYTHIGGMPTRLQESTRYVESSGFGYVTPLSIKKDPEMEELWRRHMRQTRETISKLEEYGAPKEDASNLLPLAYKTKVVCRMNLRQLIEMCHQRLCLRAYWEFRLLMNEILTSLHAYSIQWAKLIESGIFSPKCDKLGYCPEQKGCGRRPKKEIDNA